MQSIEMIRGWGTEQDAFELVDLNRQGEGAWTARLRTRGAIEKTGLTLTLTLVENSPRAVLSLEEGVEREVREAAGQSAEAVEDLRRMVGAVQDARSGPLTCEIAGVDASALRINSSIYLDGFSRNELNFAVFEIEKARHSIYQQYQAILQAAQYREQTRKLLEENEERARQFFDAPPQASPSGPREETNSTDKAAVADSSTRASAMPAPASVECLSCHGSNPQGSRFCNHCGKPLGCPACGHQNPPESRFCNQCGAPVGT